MSEQMQRVAKASSEPSFTPIQAGKIRQRQSETHELDEDCPKCRKGLPSLQRSSADMEEPSSVPPVVHEVLNSPGEPLDTGTRAFMEPRFGHDFSKVRVHTDAKAAESARVVNALAYTIGRDIVFGVGSYTGRTRVEEGVLAHELAHVIQQTNPTSTPLDKSHIAESEEQAERQAEVAALQVMNGRPVPILGTVAPTIQRLKEHFIKKITVNLTPPQSVTLEWKGTPPSEPGSDSFTCSTGKGYSNPEDSPGTCTRNCCTGTDVQCASPYDHPRKIGSCCTPVGSNFWTGKPRPEHNGWLYWTPVEPIHTSGRRGIALHQHDEVTGQAIGHGCIRMEEANAHRIYLYSRGKATNVTITGSAKVYCPTDRQCGTTGANESLGGSERLAETLTQPDGKAGIPEIPIAEEEAVA